MLFPEDYPRRPEPLPRAIAEQIMTQVEAPANLDRWDSPAYQLITLILIRCGLRITDAVRTGDDCITFDADGSPYLHYYNHKMKRQALVPIDEELHALITAQLQRNLDRWPAGIPVLSPRPTANLDGARPLSGRTYRGALRRWLERCEIRDEYGRPVHLTPHQWRHTLGNRLINRDVPQHVVQKILDHDSPGMTARYARLHDTTVRRHWENARKVNIAGDTVTLDPAGQVADAAWAKQRLPRAPPAPPPPPRGPPHPPPAPAPPPAAPPRHELTRVKAVKALHDLQRQGVPVTFGVVAATAGVSRSWLYRQADLRQQIDQLRQTEPASTSHAAEGATQSSGASLRARLNHALERNRQLADDNARLRSQLAQALGEQRQPPPQVARQRYSRHASTTIGPC